MGRPRGPYQSHPQHHQDPQDLYEPEVTEAPETLDDNAPPPPYNESYSNEEHTRHSRPNESLLQPPEKGPQNWQVHFQQRSTPPPPPSPHQNPTPPPSQGQPQLQAFPPQPPHQAAFEKPPVVQFPPQPSFLPPQDFPPPPPSQGQAQVFPPPQAFPKGPSFHQPQASFEKQKMVAEAQFPPPPRFTAPQDFPPAPHSQGQAQAFPPPQEFPKLPSFHQPQAAFENPHVVAEPQFPPPTNFPPPQDFLPPPPPHSQSQAQAFPPPHITKPWSQRRTSHQQQADFQQPQMVQFPPPPQQMGEQMGYPAAAMMPPSPTIPNAQMLPNPSPIRSVGTHQEWQSGLFDCMNDPQNAFLPCLTFGQIAEIIDYGGTSCGTSGALYGLIFALSFVPCLMSYTYRTKLRSRYGLIESPAADWVTHFSFELCALCQEYRELKARGWEPSIGWMANVVKNPSLQQQQPPLQQVAMAAPMNQRMMI